MSDEWLQNLLSNFHAAETFPVMVDESASGEHHLSSLEEYLPKNRSEIEDCFALPLHLPAVNHLEATGKVLKEILTESEISTR